MIDLNTGELIFASILIHRKVCVQDFLQYDDSVVHVNNRGNGRAIIRFQKQIESNGIFASVKVEINEPLNSRRVIILPSLQNVENMTLLEASMRWFKGVAVGDYTETNQSISGNYSWGHFSAQYMPDRDYGTCGGDIVICYEG